MSFYLSCHNHILQKTNTFSTTTKKIVKTDKLQVAELGNQGYSDAQLLKGNGMKYTKCDESTICLIERGFNQ